MDDLYDAIGTIAAFAHANGDDIDETIRPEDSQGISHGLDIYHRGNFMRIGKEAEQNRFEITSPYQFVPVLKNTISDQTLTDRVNVDLDAVSPRERNQVLQEALTHELRGATNQYD